MFEFSSTKLFDSKVCSGVSFTIRVMTDGVRSKLSLALSETMAKMRLLSGEISALDMPRDDEGNLVKVDHILMAKAMNLSDQMIALRRFTIDPEYFKIGFVSVTGLSIDGNELPDGALVKNLGPEALYQEIVERIHQEADLSVEERENLSSPTTLAARADGQTSDSTAEPASETGG